MPEPLRIALMTRFDDAGKAAIESVDPRIELLDYGNVLRGEPPTAEDKARILASLADVEIMVGSNRLEVEYFDAAPQLRWFQAMNAGLERLDRAGVLRRGFAVTNASGLASVAIAEWVIAAMFSMAKMLPAYQRQQDQHQWQWIRGGTVLEGKTCGVVGLGAIGRETAKRARAIGMRVIASRRTVDGDDPDCDAMFPYSDLHALLEQSDYVVLCVPLTKETTRLIDAAALRTMKPSAAIVNIARGDVIDQPALVAALRDGTIASAALDVTSPEPLPPDDPLWTLPNVIITPHVSSSSDRREGTAAALFTENLRRYLANEPLRNLARPELGY
jgi:phosphoglycerate dehydrogenase-like enzyme